jgi:CRP-like cAMP-binding protein
MIPSSALRAALIQDSSLAFHFLTAFAQGLALLEDRLVELGHRGVEQRVASLFLRMAGRNNTLASTIWMPGPWAQVALYLGISAESMSRQVHTMIREGVIRMVGKRGILILAPDRLKVMAQT